LSKYQCRWCGELYRYPGILRHSPTCWNRSYIETEMHIIRIANKKHPYGLDMFIERGAENVPPKTEGEYLKKGEKPETEESGCFVQGEPGAK